MHYTIEAVYHGNPEVLEWYHRAREHWNLILQEVDPLDTDNLADRLTVEQGWFQVHCGGRHIGQEVMVVTGVAQFYSPLSGFEEDNEDKAKSVLDAFERSSCSMEVKGEANAVAKSYYLY